MAKKKPTRYEVVKGFHTAAGVRFKAGESVEAKALTDHEIKVLTKAKAIEGK